MVVKKPTSTKTKNAIDLLKGDHQVLRDLLKQLTHAEDSKKRKDLLKNVEKELKIHTKIEEEIFYPAFKKAASAQKDAKLFYEATEEHHITDIVLKETKKTKVNSHQFAAKAKVIKDLVEHHAEEEETEMFPRAKKLLSQEKLLELGLLMNARREALAKKL